MAAKSADLQRQQYLVPRKSVKRLREMSRAQGVSVGELARRAIELFTSGRKEAPSEGEAAAEALLREVHTQLRDTLQRLDAEHESLCKREQALLDGRFAQRVREETVEWLHKHPEDLQVLRRLFATPAAA
jgi:hypothetical protein